jgi:hypothetical protein
LDQSRAGASYGREWAEKAHHTLEEEGQIESQGQAACGQKASREAPSLDGESRAAAPPTIAVANPTLSAETIRE